MELQKLQKPLDREKQECKVQVEAISSVAEEIASLSVRNYKETGLYTDLEYNPDWKMYLDYELVDCIRVITARYDGVLVGYAIYLINTFKHNKDVYYADLDTIWIAEAFRSGFLAIKMMKLGEKEVKDRVLFITATSVINKPIGKLLEFMGFKPAEVLYHKTIGVVDGREESSRSTSASSDESTVIEHVQPS